MNVFYIEYFNRNSEYFYVAHIHVRAKTETAAKRYVKKTTGAYMEDMRTLATLGAYPNLYNVKIHEA